MVGVEVVGGLVDGEKDGFVPCGLLGVGEAHGCGEGDREFFFEGVGGVGEGVVDGGSSVVACRGDGVGDGVVEFFLEDGARLAEGGVEGGEEPDAGVVHGFFTDAEVGCSRVVVAVVEDFLKMVGELRGEVCDCMVDEGRGVRVGGGVAVGGEGLEGVEDVVEGVPGFWDDPRGDGAVDGGGEAGGAGVVAGGDEVLFF